jgi:hypothetical protein
MKILSSLKSTFKLAAMTSAVLATSSLMNCGGGSANSDATATVRPKTLDQLRMTVNGLFNVEFRKASNSSIAEQNGQQETGAVIYVQVNENLTLTSITGKNVICYAPNTLGSATYTYTAINDNQGEIRIVGNTPTYPRLVDPTTIIVDEGWDIFPTDGAVPGTDSTLVFNVTFATDGNTITGLNNLLFAPTDIANAVTFVGGAVTTEDLTIQTAGTLTVAATSEPVPVNYGGTGVDNTLANESLDNRTISFTPNTGAFYSVDFATTSQLPLVNNVSSESGKVIVKGSGGLVIVSESTYSYSTIPGTDNATLTIDSDSGTLADGTYTLDFTSVESPPQNASGTYSMGGVSGTFTVNNPLNL